MASENCDAYDEAYQAVQICQFMIWEMEGLCSSLEKIHDIHQLCESNQLDIFDTQSKFHKFLSNC